MSERVARSAVSISWLRASWVIQAETRATAGRRRRSSSGSGAPDRGGRARGEPLRHRRDQRLAQRALAQAVVETADALAGRPRVVGARLATLTTARSAITWRTGMSSSAARRSRQAATVRTTPRALPRSWRASLMRL